MADQEPIHSHYWPGEGCIPISPQARRLGWTYEVYVTRAVWGRCISWTPDKKTNPDKRIFELLESAWEGMGKALSSEPQRVMYPFKHWYWERGRPKAKKQCKVKLGARLLLDPETEEPWILIFDPEADGMEVLTHGEPEEHTQPEDGTGGVQHTDGATVASGISPQEDAPEWESEGSNDGHARGTNTP